MDPDEGPGKGRGTSSGPRRAARLALLGALLLAVMALAAGIASADEVAWGETSVSGEESYDNLTLTLNGNLTVGVGASLTIEDSVITVNATRPEQMAIDVMQDAKLALRNVSISASGGTFGFIVRGTLEFAEGSLTDLPESHGLGVYPGGLRMVSGCSASLENVTVDNVWGVALNVSGDCALGIQGGTLRGLNSVLVVDGNCFVVIEDAELVAVSATVVVDVGGTGSSEVVILDSTLTSTSVPSAEDPELAVRVDGDSMVSLRGCTVETAELAEVTDGALSVVESTFSRTVQRSLPDLYSEGGDLDLWDLELDELYVSDGTVQLVDVAYASGEISGAAALDSVGRVPLPDTVGNDVTWEHSYWVNFQLLDSSGVPRSGLDLRLKTYDGVIFVDAVSGADGWVKHVPVHSWTVDGELETYVPSHTVEFGETDFQITHLQVYGNATVVLWNSDSSRDLNLDTDTVVIEPASPKVGQGFDVRLNGDSLVPFAYPGGTASATAKLTIDGTEWDTVTFSVDRSSDVLFRDITITTLGRHVLEVEVDALDAIEELNEGGNNRLVRLFDVTPEGPVTGDLVDLYMELTSIRDTDGDTKSPWVPGVLEIEYKVIAANAKTFPRDVRVDFLVDGSLVETRVVDLLTKEDDEFLYRGVVLINLERGTYLLRAVVDPDNEVREEYELNNEATRELEIDPEAGGFNLSAECCSAITMIALIVAVSALGAWAQRRQGQARSTDRQTIQYPESSVPGQQGMGTAVPGRASGIEDRWTTQRIESEMGNIYRAPSGDSGAERVTIRGVAPPSVRDERYKVQNMRCPRCGGSDLTGFSDGSIKCEGCRKIFFPGRGR